MSIKHEKERFLLRHHTTSITLCEQHKAPLQSLLPRGRFNDNTTCKVAENGYSYFLKYRLVYFLKSHYNSSVTAFIETLLSNIPRTRPNYATQPKYLSPQSLLCYPTA